MNKSARFIFAYYQIGYLARAFSLETTNSFSNYRLLQLFYLIRKWRPQTVIDFGSGASTVFIAEILRMNQEEFGVAGKIISYEQSPQYFEWFISKFPVSLKAFAEIHLTHVKLEWFGNYRGIYYDIQQFPKKIDFIYIDGATRTRGCPASDFPYPRLNADLLHMKNAGCQWKLAISDHRYANYPFYEKELSADYNLHLSKLFRSIVISLKN